MRVTQPRGTRGSLKWIQTLADGRAPVFEAALRAAGALSPGARFQWLSPRADDGWAEYRDGAFLERLQLQHLRPDLEAFWPARGPQWDALGRDSEGGVYLIEAKAHAGELASTCGATGGSRALIERSLAAAKAALGAAPEADWLCGHYQYANRLAHLHFLRSRAVPARLVFLYFVGDADMAGPATTDEWAATTAAAARHLGLPERKPAGVFEVFVDCRDLST